MQQCIHKIFLKRFRTWQSSQVDVIYHRHNEKNIIEKLLFKNFIKHQSVKFQNYPCSSPSPIMKVCANFFSIHNNCYLFIYNFIAYVHKARHFSPKNCIFRNFCDQIWIPVCYCSPSFLAIMKQEAFQRGGPHFSSIVRKRALSCMHNERPFLLLFSTRE